MGTGGMDKEINIRLIRTAEESEERSGWNNHFPYIITIDGEEIKDLEEFTLNLKSLGKNEGNVSASTYTVTKTFHF